MRGSLKKWFRKTVYPCIDEKTYVLKIGTLIFEKQGKFIFSSKSGRGEWM
jgi:hypothetical protein